MNQNPVFYQFKNPENLLDQLIEQFEKCGWKVQKSKPDYFHNYEWPDIVLSGDKPKEQFEARDIERMGCYRTSGNYSVQGQIVLYYETIGEVVADYLEKELSLDKDSQKYHNEYNRYIELLSTIVLIHEFVHWIMHWIESPQLSDNIFLSRRYIPIEYKETDNIWFHEGFAQLFTYFLCKEDKELKDLFIWLEKGQSEAYKKFRELISKYINTLENGICLLTFLREISTQSFEVAKSHLYDFSSILDNKKYPAKTDLASFLKKIFPDINHKHRGVIVGKKYNVA